MNRDPFDKDIYLRSKMDEYHIDVPDFPMKPKQKRFNRLIAFLASPTKNPFEKLIVTYTGVLLLKIVPVSVMFMLTLLQLIVFG